MVLNEAGDPGTWCVLHDEQALCACKSRVGRQEGIARRCSYSRDGPIRVWAPTRSSTCFRRRAEVPRRPLGAGGGSAANPRSGFS